MRCRGCDRLLHWIIANTHYVLVIPRFFVLPRPPRIAQCSNMRHLHWTDHSGIQQHSIGPLEASVMLASPFCFPCLHCSKQTSIKLDFPAENYVKLSNLYAWNVSYRAMVHESYLQESNSTFICLWFCSKLSRHQMFPEMRVFVTL
jgi:hypothetical protein